MFLPAFIMHKGNFCVNSVYYGILHTRGDKKVMQMGGFLSKEKLNTKFLTATHLIRTTH